MTKLLNFNMPSISKGGMIGVLSGAGGSPAEPTVCTNYNSAGGTDARGIGSSRDGAGIQILASNPSIGKIPTCSFDLYAQGSPSGTCYVRLYNSSGTVKATSDTTLDVTTISTSAYTSYPFTFSSGTIAANDFLMLVGGTWDSNNQVNLKTSNGGGYSSSYNQLAADRVGTTNSAIASRNAWWCYTE